MRDAMLRTAGAGTLVADAMGLADDAWGENTALTTEAALMELPASSSVSSSGSVASRT